MSEGPDRTNQMPSKDAGATPSQSKSPSRASTLFSTHGPIVLVAAVALWLTDPYTQADSPGYANEVVQYGETPLFSQGNILWEFGHLVWRPLGWALLQLASLLETPSTTWDATLLVLRALTWVSVASALITVVLWHSLALRASRSRFLAFALVLGLASTNSFLLYAQNGSSYVPGLCCATLGLWLVVEALSRESPRSLWALGAGCAMALAALLWFPYILSVPGIAAAAIFWQARAEHTTRPQWRKRLRFAALAVASFTLLVLAVYLAAGWIRGLRSASQYIAWLSDSSHGWSQSLKVARMATGLPRSFVNLSRDGILWKRFLFDDPYSPVGLSDLLIRAGLWKLTAFYVMAVAVVWNCLKSRFGRESLAIVAATAVPLFFFAIFLFEPGSAERYFPAFPFLTLALAGAIDPGRSSRISVLAILISFGVMVSTNLYYMSSLSVNREVDHTLSRLVLLKPHLHSTSVVFALTYADPACAFRRDFPFHPFNSAGGIVIFDLVEIATERILTWKEDFARKALSTWEAGGDVWVTKRVWAKHPLTDWHWVEGDDPRICWEDLYTFFEPLQINGGTGGRDGFSRISAGSENHKVLLDLLRYTEPAAEP